MKAASDSEVAWRRPVCRFMIHDSALQTADSQLLPFRGWGYCLALGREKKSIHLQKMVSRPQTKHSSYRKYCMGNLLHFSWMVCVSHHVNFFVYCTAVIAMVGIKRGILDFSL